MRWLAAFSAPLILWAGLFSAVYALHGLGCARGWPAVSTPFGSLHGVAMVAVWLGGLAVHLVLLRTAPTGPGLEHRLLRMTGWIGVCASLLTLWPVVTLTTCQALP